MTTELQIGDIAPDINLPTDADKNFSLSKTDKNVVVYFYPKDNTPGCTIEAKDFANLHAEFEAIDTVIIGISKDSLAKHDKFKNKYDLPFSLASDQDGDICENYSVWKEKSMFGKKYMGIVRQTFLIGKDKKIKHIWPKVSIIGHAKEVLEKAKML